MTMREPAGDGTVRPGDASVTEPRPDVPRTADTGHSHIETGALASQSSDASPTDEVVRNLLHQLDPTHGRSFHPEQVVAERFRIVRYIARGGMGEVYEAEDLRLKERVALKTIRPEIARDSAAMVRFERELRLARKVTHRNVCRLFDLQTHRSEGQEVTFLSMELLSGVTLSDHLESKGRLTEREAMPLVRQMCAALGAARDAGVVHRDFKSANVLLCGPAEKLRVVVTDFGLAQQSDSGNSKDRDTSITAPGKLVGTPAYMAPEQLENKELSSATDLYALGLVMYEM